VRCNLEPDEGGERESAPSLAVTFAPKKQATQAVEMYTDDIQLAGKRHGAKLGWMKEQNYSDKILDSSKSACNLSA
jgi:hypothetical protein